MLRRDLFKYLAALSTATLIAPETLFAAKYSILNEVASLCIMTTFELEQIFTSGLIAFEEPESLITTVSIEYKDGSTYEFVGNFKKWILTKESSEKEFNILDLELFNDSVVIHTNHGQCVIEKNRYI